MGSANQLNPGAIMIREAIKDEKGVNNKGCGAKIKLGSANQLDPGTIMIRKRNEKWEKVNNTGYSAKHVSAQIIGEAAQ
ncbi:hypothetical protein [Cytobacillus sp. BC1816]|uniref:hypothetical protein n=1 Tax=Cytobacillus sp. BC1816 TaxID=3440154 RepID=UPI003F518AB8